MVTILMPYVRREQLRRAVVLAALALGVVLASVAGDSVTAQYVAASLESLPAHSRPSPILAQTEDCRPLWQIIAGADPNGPGWWEALYGIAALATDDIWAVGNYADPDRGQTPSPLVEHWNGTSWAVVPAAVPGGYASRLSDVAMISTDNIWAVGSNYIGLGYTGGLIEHWDGHAWSIIPRQQTRPTQYPTQTYLNGVAAGSNDDVWVVGSTSESPTSTQTFIQHWDGGGWGIEPSGVVTGTLNDVAVLSSDDAWAVGSVILHWNGARWEMVAHPAPSPIPSMPYEFNSAVALASDDVWIVGDYGYGGTAGPLRPLIMHWDGTAWSIVPSPQTSGAGSSWLSGVAGAAAGDIWAVGVAQERETLTMHWDGMAWTIVPSPNADAERNWLWGVAVTSHEVWSTGGSENDDAQSALIARYGSALEFSDLPAGDPFYSFVRCLACRGVISGYSDRTFRPYNSITREQAAKIVSNAAGYSEAIPLSRQTFSDVPPDSPFWVYVERMASHGAMSGYADGSFRPGNNLTRGQLARIDAQAAGYDDVIPGTRQTFSDVPVGSTFWLYIERIALHAVVSGYADGTFRPYDDVTRGQSAKIVANSFSPNCQPLEGKP